MPNISFIKGRTLECTKEVQVHRNVNMEGIVYSIRQNGVVIGHSPNLSLVNVKFHVNQKGRERVIASGVKNVHAYVKGFIVEDDSPELVKIRGTLDSVEVTYNPFVDTHFVPRLDPRYNSNIVSIKPLGAMIATLNSRGLSCYGLLIETKND